MSEPLSPRVARALGVDPALAVLEGDGRVRVEVDDVDRRYRDAIKAGARGHTSPACSRDGNGRTAVLLDADGPLWVRLMSRSDG